MRFRQRTLTVAQYFATPPGVAHTLHLRGGEAVTVILGSARLSVGTHEQKRLVVALKYPGEEDYRYLVASDLMAGGGHRLRIPLEVARRGFL